MRPIDFVEALRTECRDAAVSGCVSQFERPSGKKPSPELGRLSDWYNNLSEDDKELVVAAMKRAADATLFGVLCVIDGVRTIEGQGDKSEFRLTATRASSTCLIAPSDELLHDIYRSAP